MSELLNDILKPYIRKNWHRPLSIILPVAISSALLLLWLPVNAAGRYSLTQYMLVAFIAAVEFGFWLHSNAAERAKKGTIGFIVAIHVSDMTQRRTIKEDFVDSIQNLLNSCPAETPYSVLVPSSDIAERIHSREDAAKYLRKARSKFMIYGTVRLRTLNNQECHILRLTALVLHESVSQAIGTQLSREMTDVIPIHQNISTENDLASLEFSAQSIVIGAQYVIAITSFMSNRLDYAEELYDKISTSLQSQILDIPHMQSIKNRLPTRYDEIYAERTKECVPQWIATKDISVIKKLDSLLDTWMSKNPHSYRAKIRRMICHFVLRRDIKAAIGIAHELRDAKVKDPLWRTSFAFLLAYDDQLQQARQQYRILQESNRLNPATVLEIEVFIQYALEDEPDKIQLHFCLALINDLFKHDCGRAIDEYQLFVQKASSKCRQYRQWIQESKSSMARLKRRVRLYPDGSPPTTRC